MSGLLPIQSKSLDNYFLWRDRWLKAINEYTARSSCSLPFYRAREAFFSPTKNYDWWIEGFRNGFELILERQVSAVCEYLQVGKETLVDYM